MGQEANQLPHVLADDSFDLWGQIVKVCVGTNRHSAMRGGNANVAHRGVPDPEYAFESLGNDLTTLVPDWLHPLLMSHIPRHSPSFPQKCPPT